MQRKMAMMMFVFMTRYQFYKTQSETNMLFAA